MCSSSAVVILVPVFVMRQSSFSIIYPIEIEIKDTTYTDRSASIIYQGNPDMYHKLWNTVSTERYILYMKVLLECSHPFFNGVHDARPSVFCGVQTF
jgi:hypothetical protein